MGPFVHYRLTSVWALQEGFSAEDAERIAVADRGVDREFPAGASLWGVCHHFGPMALAMSARYRRRALKTRSLEDLGRALHCAQDAVAHGVLGLAHLRWDMHIGRDPDDWTHAPEWERQHIERLTRALLARYRAAG